MGGWSCEPCRLRCPFIINLYQRGFLKKIWEIEGNQSANQIPEPKRSSSYASNCIFILRGIINEADDVRSRYTTVDAVLLFVSKDFSCIDLSLSKLELKGW